MAEQDRHPGVQIEGAPIGSLLLQVTRAHALLGTELLRRVGITAPHEIVLLHLDDHGPLPQSELVRYLGRDRSTVTNTLQAMERAGLVRRTPSTRDGRAMDVALTPAGRRAVPAARAAWAELERATCSRLTATQQSRLAAALETVRDSLNAALDADG